MSQRESYGQFLAACYAFVDAGHRIVPHFGPEYRRRGLSPLSGTPEEALGELNTLARRIGECAAVVRLDGPPHIAQLSHDVWEAAGLIALEARLAWRRESSNNLRPFERGLRFDEAMTTFAEEASAHLNTGLLPWWRRRRARRAHVSPVPTPGP